MATNQILTVTGNPLSFADHATDFTTPTAAYAIEHDTPTPVQLDLTSLAAAAARQSAKFDFGAAWAQEWWIQSVIEVASAAATDTEYCEYWMGYSHNATAANGNSGALSGSDAAYTGTGASALTPSLRQLRLVGVHQTTLDDTLDSPEVQIADAGTFRPIARYGILVVVNKMTGAFHTVMDQTNIVISPVIPRVEAAV